MALLHEKLIKHLRNRNHCKNCPYTEDCNSFEGCLMDLLAADAIEDLNFQIVELRKELNEEKLAHYVLINLSRLGADLPRFIRRLERDLVDRKRSLDSIINQYLNSVRPMHHAFVEPSKVFADLIIPEGGHNMIALDFIVTKINNLLTHQK